MASPAIPQLGFVQTAKTASGTVEVHIDTFSNGSYHRVLNAASDFTVGTGLGPLQLFGSVNGEPELGFVLSPDFQHFPAEVFVDDFSNGSYQRTSSPFSDLRPDEVPSPTFQLFGRDNGEPELGSINYANTVSGTVEVHADAITNGSYQQFLDSGSDFSPADAANGTFQLLGS